MKNVFMMFAALIFMCSNVFAQAPVPVPDPGPGVDVSICQECCGLEEAITDKQALYEAMESELDALYELLEETKSSDLPPSEKAEQIAHIQLMINVKQLLMSITAEQIGDLWNQWFDLGCDEADC